MIFDSHMHTKFSTDSKMKIEEVIKRAKELNIGIITTEHMDLNYPTPGTFVFNTEEYLREYSQFRSDSLLLGIELGMIADRTQDNKSMIDSNAFDYVIGSVHLVDNIDIYDKMFYVDKNKKAAYEHYFSYMLKCIKSHNFIDSLGHIDYIARYSVYEDKEIYYHSFSEYIDEVLKAVAESNISLEINTRRLADKTAVKNLIKIYKRFNEFGGKIVTIGSDAHNPSAIGLNFAEAIDIAKECKLKIVYYKERRPEYVKL